MKKGIRHYIVCIALLTSYFLLPACGKIDVFEKNVTIPQQAWSSSFVPDVAFTVAPEDTLSRYHIFIVVRHTDAYRYKNIWINIKTEAPGGAERKNQPLNLQLATDAKGWLGSGMDDIFERRIQITSDNYPQQLHAGTYHFKLENIMREDPLKGVMNVGIRLQKAQ